MAQIVQLAVGNVNARVVNADREIKLLLSDLLSYLVEGHEFMAAFKSGGWNGRSSFYSYGKDVFPAGFAPLVQAELRKRGYEVQLVVKPRPAPQGPSDFEGFDGRGGDPRYDYQGGAVRQLLRRGHMVAQVATGGGKSRICGMAAAAIRRTTLFLTTRSVLMYQMADSFSQIGMVPGILGDGEWTLRRGVNCAMVQTLMARLKEPDPNDHSPAAQAQRQLREKTIKALSIFEFVIGEEAHEAGGNSYFEILRHCRNAAYRLALTATPFMRPDAEANMRLMAAFGEVGVQVSEKMLIDRGILARPFFKFASIEQPKGLFKSTAWQRAYKMGIVEAEPRNRQIVFEVARAAQYGLPSLTLVQHKAHGELLHERFRAGGIRSAFIFGEHDNAARRRALNALANRELDVLIGSTILDVGVDVPAVGFVALAGGGKAEVALRQRIGRGLRAKKSGSNVAFVLDFQDEHNLHLRDHYRTRRDIVEGTPGFAEGILPANADFPYERYFGSVAAA